MEKLKLHTPDLIERNIERLAELFPGCITEARDENGRLTRAVDFDQLRQELSNSVVEGPREKYQLDWPGKREAVLAANAPIAKTLRPTRNESVGFDETKNLFIEGDNLDALKLLQETYLDRVRLIYIDPPYNTGSDLVYSDEFKAAILINEQKATVIVEHLSYSPVEETWNSDIFTQAKPRDSFSRAVKSNNRHIYDYVFTDSATEKKFVTELDTSTDVVVYAKLPGGFAIPTPVGDYNPDWAIAFQEGSVKHIYFVAETKGSLSSLQLREIEKCKIDCARKFFSKITSEQVRYEVVDSYLKLMELVK